jgi:hypothetical protein
MNSPPPGYVREVDPPKKNPGARPSPITLWRPEIVLPEGPIAHRAVVLLGEPELRPEAMRAQLDSTRTALDALAEKRDALSMRAACAEARVRDAQTDQERVTAMFETYRVESALDDVLTGTMRELTSLMRARGLR